MDDRLQSEEALSHELIRYTRLHHILKSRISLAFPDGLDHAALGVLLTLIKRGALRQGELADVALLDPSTVSRHVGQLVRAGLVERRPDPGDGRAVRLAATDRGHELGDELLQRRRTLIHQTLASWLHDDVRELAGLLSRLNDDFEAQRPLLGCPEPPAPVRLHTVNRSASVNRPVTSPIEQEY
jgi:DNA-binding MarR family transcriptional regulator